jgi:hypothetical protein
MDARGKAGIGYVANAVGGSKAGQPATDFFGMFASGASDGAHLGLRIERAEQRLDAAGLLIGFEQQRLQGARQAAIGIIGNAWVERDIVFLQEQPLCTLPLRVVLPGELRCAGAGH